MWLGIKPIILFQKKKKSVENRLATKLQKLESVDSAPTDSEHVLNGFALTHRKLTFDVRCRIQLKNVLNNNNIVQTAGDEAEIRLR